MKKAEPQADDAPSDTMKPDIISRGDAKARGLKHYFTGRPCKHGHVSVRFVSGACKACGAMHDAARDNAKRNPSDKLYRAKHKARIAVRRRKRYAENREKFHAVRREWEAKNRGSIVARRRAWNAKNPDRVRAWRKKRRDKIGDLLAVLKTEMPELLKEFGL